MTFDEYYGGAKEIARKFDLHTFLRVDQSNGECSFEGQGKCVPKASGMALSELNAYRKKNWGQK